MPGGAQTQTSLVSYWLTLLLLMVSPALGAPEVPNQTPANSWPIANAQPEASDPYGGRVVMTAVDFTDLVVDGENTHLPVVKARIGTVDVTFLIDTGSISTGISPSLAKRLGLTPKSLLPEGQRNAFGHKVLAVDRPLMQLGDLNYTPSLILVFENSVWNSLGLNVDGIIGLRSLGQFLLEFDYPHHRLTFLNAKAVTPEMREKAGYGASSYSADITKTEDGFYQVDLNLSAGQWRSSESANIDTGAYATQISAKAARALHLSPIGSPIINGGLRKQQEVNLSQIGELRVGALQISDVSVQYPDKDDPTGVIPTLGANILSRYKVLLDFPGKKMYLQPIPPPKHTITIGPTAPATPAPAK